MTQAPENATQQRDRSPAYPIVPLGIAIDRLVQFDEHFKRTPARPEAVGGAWSISGKAYTDRIIAALRYFGFLEYQGSGKERKITVSDEGRKYLRAQQEETKQQIVRGAALRPKNISKYWNLWGADRPADAARLEQLTFEDGFSDQGALDFLKVYDATISYAGLTDSDKVEVPDEPADGNENSPSSHHISAEKSRDVVAGGVKLNPPAPAKIVEKPGMKQDVFTLEEGDVVFQWPERISKESFEDLESWMEIQMRKIGRRVVSRQPNQVADDVAENVVDDG